MILKSESDTLAQLMGEPFTSRLENDDRRRSVVPPQGILWQSRDAEGMVDNAACLLANRRGQVMVGASDCCVLRGKAGLLLDFGVELCGGVRILAHSPENDCRTFRLRVRFGESAMEAMSELGGSTNATNDHAIRDTVVDVSSMGGTEVGGTGFRFVRIDLMEGGPIVLEEVTAVFVHRDIACLGAFECSDPLLESIWRTGAYTVFLNMQNYLWDGVKRDRIVWIGDMHPETSTIQAVFGQDPVVPKSLDFVRDTTPLPGWMNSFPSYSMWWVLIQHSWYRQNGDHDYLVRQKPYLLELLRLLAGSVDPSGRSKPDGSVFLDWPSVASPQAAGAGVHALHALTLERGAELCRFLGESGAAAACLAAAGRLKACRMDPAGSKQAAAMLVLAGMEDAGRVNETVLKPGGARGLSSFLGYYVLQARAMAGDAAGCLDMIRAYWGGMLSLGATTFWENFEIDWLRDAARIDEITPEGWVDVHGTYGDYCYRGYRHSLCHGWASGPTAWLSEHVLGIRVMEPGCRVVRIMPELGDLDWAGGAYPTPFGTLRVRHQRRPDGSVATEYEAPAGVRVLV